MDDVELVEAARRGERGAFAEIYDRYGPRIHALCTRLLNEPHTAADATQDTFVVAAQRLDQLRDPTKLRAWLYAIARNECTRHGRARGRLVPVEEVDVMSTDDVDDPANRAASADVAELLWAAAEGLDQRDKVLLELNLRHGLEGQELAEAAGIAPGQISMATGRMRERVERSLGALLVARRGRKDCPGLDAVLTGWDGTFSVLMRKRVARHVERCEVCERKKAALVAPLGSLAVVPFVVPPADLRATVLGEIDRILSASPSSGEGGRDLPALHEAWPGGFPPPMDAGDGGRRRPALLALAAAVVLVLLVVGGLALTGGSDDGDEVATGPGATTTVAGDDEAPGTTPTEGTTTEVDGTTTTTPGATTTTAPGATTTTTTPDAAGPEATTTAPPLADPDPDDPDRPGGPPIVLNPPDATTPTTQPPPPNQRPTIGPTSIDDAEPMQTSCNPGNATRTITVAAGDADGPVTVRLHWARAGGSGADSKAMARSGGTWSATLGPFASVGELRYWAIVTDQAGATSEAATTTIEVFPCPG